MKRERNESTSQLPAYLGVSTFMRCPESRELKGVDTAVMGVPFDSGATSFRSGARLGPRKIREASMLLWGFNACLGLAPLDVLNVVDYGDVIVEPASLEETEMLIHSEARGVLSAGVRLMSLGGDHSVTLPLLRAHREIFGPVAVVHLDAHVDTEKDRMDHGTVFRHAAEEGLINTEAWVQVGVRGPISYPEEVEDARDLGAKVLGMDEIEDTGIPQVIRVIHETIGSHPAYVSLDIDVVDPAYAPGTGTPEVGGMTSREILKLVRGLRGLNLVGFDLVEVSPPYDHGDITSILAANLVFEFLSLLALESERR
ncbi:MAG: agmatinase [Deltaproteobacteria bacterium]|nr:agmatinase [Deltaproteobacteria bacterium]